MIAPEANDEFLSRIIIDISEGWASTPLAGTMRLAADWNHQEARVAIELHSFGVIDEGEPTVAIRTEADRYLVQSVAIPIADGGDVLALDDDGCQSSQFGLATRTRAELGRAPGCPANSDNASSRIAI